MADPARPANQRADRAGWQLLALGGFLILLVWRLLAPRGAAATAQPISARAPAATSEDSAHAVHVREHQEEAPKTAFEPTDWALAPVALIYFGILVLLVVSSFVIIAAYPTSLPDVSRRLRIAPPGPQLQTDPQADLRRFRAEEERRLNTYYWFDKRNGLVHIPIEEAMKKLATTGVPGFPKQQQ
ncbi:MAG TPA: hypothetical protein VH678_07485 [Xanthobacteraceae bacterium]|jgi:hypothetical protein